jgi:hypothetical protein
MKKSFAILGATLGIMGVLIISIKTAVTLDTPPVQVVATYKTGDLPPKEVRQAEPDPGIVVQIAKDVVGGDVDLNQLRNVPVNQDRLDSFSGFLNHERVRVAGWECTITKIVKNGDSTIATVRAQPILRSKVGGYPSTPAYVDEEYELKDGELTFVRKTGGGHYTFITWN